MLPSGYLVARFTTRFDQHIVRMDDGTYWVADEGAYETLIEDLVDRIVHTVDAGQSDE